MSKLGLPYLKGVDKKTLHLNFCFAHISASICRIFKILVPTQHNIPLIMGGRHKNFKDPMYKSWDMSKIKIQNQCFFCTPFSTFASIAVHFRESWCFNVVTLQLESHLIYQMIDVLVYEEKCSCHIMRFTLAKLLWSLKIVPIKSL